MACPRNSISYNGTRCACGPGQLLNRSTGGCELFGLPSTISTDSGVDYYTISFPETIFSFDSIRKFTQSQAVFLEATLILLLSWLVFCFVLRFTKLRDGRNVWFNLRWWISRLDICFATRHWLEDQQVVKKRKTELGGTLSVASWILFIGLFAALLYQIITKRSIEVHNVRATNSPDLASFANNIEFNITTISSMSCLNLRGIGNVVAGNPGFSDYKVTSLSTFGSYACHNTTLGPTINFECSKCHLADDYTYISWHFVDLPGAPATAVGFQFNFTSWNPENRRHLSFVGGTLKNGSNLEDRPVTFRGTQENILKFNLFPRVYRNLHDLKLFQPLFHEFVPGSNYGDTAQLQASLERSSDGIVNTTLFVNFLSAYLVEIDNESILGPVSFLADLGGIYCISIGIFFYLLVQCEYRIKMLRNEDTFLRKIRARRRALGHWDKLRRYVAYTWDCSLLGNELEKARNGSTFRGLLRPSTLDEGSVLESGSSRGKWQQNRMLSVGFSKKHISSSEKDVIAEPAMKELKSFELDSALGHGDKFSVNKDLQVRADTENDGSPSDILPDDNVVEPHSLSHTVDDIIPPPPPTEFHGGSGSEIDMVDIQKKFQLLHDYNVLLREKLIESQSQINALAFRLSSSSAERKR